MHAYSSSASNAVHIGRIKPWRSGLLPALQHYPDLVQRDATYRECTSRPASDIGEIVSVMNPSSCLGHTFVGVVLGTTRGQTKKSFLRTLLFGTRTRGETTGGELGWRGRERRLRAGYNPCRFF